MSSKNLQKNAETIQNNDPVPDEVLNPVKTAQKYTFRLYPPSEKLAPFVEYYWIMRWDLKNEPPFAAEVIPSPYTNLTCMPGGSRITGVTTGKYTYTLEGTGAIIGAKFHPGGIHTFYKKSVRNLTDIHIAADVVFPELSDSRNEEVMAMSDIEAVTFFDELLLSYDPQIDRNLELVTKIMKYIETAEQPTTAEITALTHLSGRRVQEIFQEYVGVGLKHIILRERLIKAALKALEHNISWTAIAAELGYVDQSHFINDFKRIIGKTPKEYAKDIH